MRRAGEHARNRSAPASSVKKAAQTLAKAANITLNGSATSPSSSRGEARRKVLIIEDNLVNQRVLQKQLEKLGTEVHLANHGGEALDKLQQSTYWTEGDSSSGRLELGVLLMDQEMPVMDGLTCTKRIRELENEGKLTGHIPIIAVTANARAEQVQTALEAGMVSFLIYAVNDC
jgi:CheY-like chemotaxis protein